MNVPARQFPVSIKGVIIAAGGIVLLKNERDEWELPGGKLESGETPETCLAREIKEELGVETAAMQLLDCWLYEITDKVEVLIVTFGCRPIDCEKLTLSAEHKELRVFPIDEIPSVKMPQGYKNSIYAWTKLQTSMPGIASGAR